ncbi:unnamed protein product [Rangifer tarandus platyrhynchus]|uniref:Uncharacterized protein n=1 Tax=Rangifer tarandus platyrhynchus TaxID=3082113 RepID=A0ABN8XIG5_RANTA|nr:unnamed protein product [Rangifer tarandus platyrhynchus]
MLHSLPAAQPAAAAKTAREPEDPESCALPAAEITRSAAVQYVFDHRILDLFKNLLSRLFYSKPENVRGFLISELSKIDEARHLSATQAAEGAAAANNGTPPSENLQSLESPAADKELGIFNVNDFPVYFNLLSGDEKDNIPGAQLLHLGFLLRGHFLEEDWTFPDVPDVSRAGVSLASTRSREGSRDTNQIDAAARPATTAKTHATLFRIARR